MRDLNSIPTPIPTIASRIMDREAVLVHPSQGKVKVLNELGAEIWKRLDGVRTIGEITDDLLRVYAVSRADLERDVIGFIESLLERDLITIRDPDGSP
jgi:hypothetical protein